MLLPADPSSSPRPETMLKIGAGRCKCGSARPLDGCRDSGSFPTIRTEARFNALPIRGQQTSCYVRLSGEQIIEHRPKSIVGVLHVTSCEVLRLLLIRPFGPNQPLRPNVGPGFCVTKVFGKAVSHLVHDEWRNWSTHLDCNSRTNLDLALRETELCKHSSTNKRVRLFFRYVDYCLKQTKAPLYGLRLGFQSVFFPACHANDNRVLLDTDLTLHGSPGDPCGSQCTNGSKDVAGEAQPVLQLQSRLGHSDGRTNSHQRRQHDGENHQSNRTQTLVKLPHARRMADRADGVESFLFSVC